MKESETGDNLHNVEITEEKAGSQCSAMSLTPVCALQHLRPSQVMGEGRSGRGERELMFVLSSPPLSHWLDWRKKTCLRYQNMNMDGEIILLSVLSH